MLSLIFMIINYLMILIAMSFFTLLERKFLGYVQLRKGPNKISMMGIPLPFADAIKLFCKEYSNLNISNFFLFMASPIFMLSMSIMMWSLYPISYPLIFFSFGSLLFICFSSIMVYPLILSGWSSNSKYALIGAIRSIAQTISYEVSMFFIFLSIIILLLEFNLNKILMNHFTPLILVIPFLLLLWVSTMLAETNRTPFDLSEGESELVSGFNIEYSSNSFAFIFMAEYTSILSMSMFSSIFFFNSFFFIMNDLILTLKILLFTCLFIWIRGTFPRIRYDNLMSLTWKCFLPVSIFSLMFTVSLSYSL
uniref:NADH-ubiquinone oxidoreductase chain 1 n=1 Tax=Siboglinum fiordicum TaxID=27908 RepID=A0A0E3DR76_9ANNE|nr:NADH dehydrogenase subunit 1 [Siboglinum fiordicum]AIL54871.1 NADH dehydrogenase subunit 1 [Siboglinum fiordicum]